MILRLLVPILAIAAVFASCTEEPVDAEVASPTNVPLQSIGSTQETTPASSPELSTGTSLPVASATPQGLQPTVLAATATATAPATSVPQGLAATVAPSNTAPAATNAPALPTNTPVAPTATATLATNTPLPPTSVPSTNTPPPPPTSTPSPTAIPSDGRIWYTSAHHSAQYYYCDLDQGWKQLAPSNLRSYPSEAALKAAWGGSRVKHPESKC